ncbi:hypothetical protein MITS9509_02040 [Synechococcus sp. MIT S9509]|uniref:hypothetical protein n=1 Tax=unclassified Synechococcus TaxID=2626047 RepID=UPI0007BBDD13|nr:MULTISPECIES: hypothetical protein [unclassified Synechococcus]KZR84626.1 hypothetical protein MITS9504_02838 [Synechococcus sp. MIT S9504]KZR91708.1 hypothetical protein MITS9509_02040 [Synechococcus sp. MIT S9509]
MAATTFSTSGPRNAGKSRCSLASGSSGLSSAGSSGFFEGGHQLEKLEFALAVAITRGDQSKSDQLRAQIADLGGNIEEPGT